MPPSNKIIMAETKYESQICSIPNSAENVYRVLSNLDNLNRVKDMIPQDKVQELEVHPDNIRMKVDGLGQKITIRIEDTIENDTIKFGTEGIPMQANFWIQLKQVTPTDTRIRLTFKADLPLMFKMMLDKKIQQGLDDAAKMLTQFPYNQWL